MKTRGQNLFVVLALLALSTLNPQPSNCYAQGTVFTYQGQLQNSGSPASGTYNLKFSLFATNTTGVPIAGPVTNNGVVVTSGLFTVQIDFGPGAFAGGTNWLQIGVETNLAGSFTTLTPRQQLTPVPYAIFAESANSLPGLLVQSNTNGAPNIIGGSPLNFVSSGVVGAAVGGGGAVNYSGSAYSNSVTASFGTVGGGVDNTASFVSTVGGGYDNTASGRETVISGGRQNNAGGDFSTVGGGSGNNAGGAGDTLAGGFNNSSSGGNNSTISGGTGNDSSGSDAVIGGGLSNSVSAFYSTIGGGVSNTATNNSAVVSGGTNNVSGGYASTVSGGDSNMAGNDDATAGGGDNNIAGGYASVISGGEYNSAGQDHTTVAGGSSNYAGGSYGAVGGGQGNNAGGAGDVLAGGYNNYSAGGNNSTISGGNNNNSSGSDAVIGGGQANQVGAFFTTVGGGVNNVASDDTAVVSGGTNNVSGGYASAVAGGSDNLALGDYSFAAGNFAQATNNHSFVWSDGSTDTTSATNNQFVARAMNGFVFYTASDGITGVSLAPGATSWATLSDRNAKKDFAPVDTGAVLDKLAAVPVEQWRYKWEADSGTPNIGPMAQDFIHAFYPGRDDKSITTLEFDGVELAAIQGLDRKLEETRAENAKLKQQNDSLVERLDELEAAVKSLAEKK